MENYYRQNHIASHQNRTTSSSGSGVGFLNFTAHDMYKTNHIKQEINVENVKELKTETHKINRQNFTTGRQVAIRMCLREKLSQQVCFSGNDI